MENGAKPKQRSFKTIDVSGFSSSNEIETINISSLKDSSHRMTPRDKNLFGVTSQDNKKESIYINSRDFSETLLNNDSADLPHFIFEDSDDRFFETSRGHQNEFRSEFQKDDCILSSLSSSYETRQFSDREQFDLGASLAIHFTLQAYNIFVKTEDVKKTLRIRPRNESSDLTDYIFSRYESGTSIQNIISSIKSLSHGSIEGRFFPSLYKESYGNVVSWLRSWMSKGGVALLTRNPQRAALRQQSFVDDWSHQNIYGINQSSGVILINPKENLSENDLIEQLMSPSELLLRRSDIVHRWHDKVDLRPLMNSPNEDWESFNVLGQIIHVLREDLSNPNSVSSLPFIRIPSFHEPGITIFLHKDSPYIHDLKAL